MPLLPQVGLNCFGPLTPTASIHAPPCCTCRAASRPFLALPLQLAPTYDFVAPCFPPEYDIFGAICGEHHRQLGSMVDFIGLCADNLANSDILKVGRAGEAAGLLD